MIARWDVAIIDPKRVAGRRA